MTVAVVLASANRAEMLARAVADVDGQSVSVHHRVLSVPNVASLPGGETPPGWVVVHETGLSAQRNAGIIAVPDADVIFFFDDDAVVRADYIENAIEIFAKDPKVLGLTGRVLLDGAAGREIGLEEAATALKMSAQVSPSRQIKKVKRLYGCNFAYRAVAARNVLFDDRLPLYSWLEDHDFARRLMRLGPLVWAENCVIVHRGAKSGGRTSHTRLGYSQVMNPSYLVQKGSFPLVLAVREMFRPVAKNVAYSVAGPERRWRRERLRGNLIAASDVARFRFTPERIREF